MSDKHKCNVPGCDGTEGVHLGIGRSTDTAPSAPKQVLRSVHPAPPTPESGPRPCTEHEYQCYKCGEAEQGQAALELVLDIAAKERPEALNARFIWRRSKEILEGEKKDGE